MRLSALTLATIAITASNAVPAAAQLTSPMIGWQATFSMLAYEVSGTATIIDEDTVQVDDFRYVGAAPAVYFYLGTELSQDAFVSGIGIGPEITMQYYGDQEPLILNLPPGQTLEGWNAISVWCVDFSADFGSGTFMAPPQPGDLNGDGRVDGDDFIDWQAGAIGVPISDIPLDEWRADFGARAVGAAQPVPEPASIMMILGLAGLSIETNRRTRYETSRKSLQ